MLLVVESILGGTWGGSEAAPEEWVDFRLMRDMGWTFEQLQATPRYVRSFCVDFLSLEGEAEAKAAKS